jgi:hypothetical protein
LTIGATMMINEKMLVMMKIKTNIPIAAPFVVMAYTNHADPYNLPASIVLVAINSDSDKLREFLHAKIAKRKKQIHPEQQCKIQS